MCRFKLPIKLLCLLIATLIFKTNTVAQDMNPTPAIIPPTVKSNEANKKQLADAKAEGDSINNCINWILSQAGNNGGQVRAGEYKITYAITAPEGWYTYNNQSVTWVNPQNANAHLWLFFQDANDNRLIPGLKVEASVVNSDGNTVEQTEIPYAWIPLINGYANNLNFNGDGNYTIQLKILPPFYHRHDPYNGDRFTRVVYAKIPVNYSMSSIPQQPLSEKMESETQLSKSQGDAFKNTLQAMYKQATDGKDTTVGDYFIAVADEYSEGYWFYKKDKFTYLWSNEQSAKTNGHVEVAVCDARTGRFLHDMDIKVHLYKGDQDLGNKSIPFMWHPWLYHYGKNWRVPSPGSDYVFHVHFDPPPYRRYGKNLGKQFTSPVDIDFKNITIKTGEK